MRPASRASIAQIKQIEGYSTAAARRTDFVITAAVDLCMSAATVAVLMLIVAMLLSGCASVQSNADDHEDCAAMHHTASEGYRACRLKMDDRRQKRLGGVR
jgi:hypothetical protein